MNGNTGDREDVVVFWDFETPPSLSSAAAISTYEMVTNVRSAVAAYGPLKSIRLYWDYGSHPFPSTTMRLRSEFSASGVSLIDCPGEGRQGAAIKKMLVDMIFHAWDSPLPSTIVVITGDRDVAYALAMLRMKSYRVVLISPTGSHPDLTSQASVQLDRSRTILGINGGSDEDGLFPKESPDRMPSSSQAPARSGPSNLGQETFTFRSDLPLRDGPAPAQKPSSIFSSSYDYVFGGPRFPSPRSSLGLGDGPLFPRPQSANQNPLCSRSGSLSDLLRPTAVANKGKNKASEPEEIYPPPPPPSSRLRSSASMFEPFNDDDDDGLPPSRHSPTTGAAPERDVSRNSSGSLQSKFSFEQISKPTDANALAPVEQPRTPSDGELARLPNEPQAEVAVSSVSSVSSGAQKTKKNTKQPTVVPSTPSTQAAKAAKTTASQKAVRASSISKPTPVVPSKPLPAAWAPLIKTLRKHNGVLARSTVAPTLLAHYPNAFETAGAKSVKRYLNAAISAGIVLKNVRADGIPEIHLKPPY